MSNVEEIKLTGKSKDIVLDNISILKELFPEIVVEDKIDFDTLKEILGENIDDSKEKYGFTWPGKTQAIKESQKQSTGTLRPCKDESEHWDKTKNLYIEGDNLEVLKLLQKAYYNKIKCIYIDPPYNTGKDFIYTDDYQDNLENYLKLSGQSQENSTNAHRVKLTNNPETGGRYHSKWLTFIYPRLKLARNLLKETGAMIISIDDNEYYTVKNICNEVFGEENCVIDGVVNRPSEIGTEFTIKKHEYFLVYAKNINKLELSGSEKYTISRGTVGNQNQTMPVIEFPAGLRCEDIPDGTYSQTRKIKDSMENIENFGEIVVENGKLKYPIELKARWRSSNDMRNFFNNDCKPTKAKINGVIEEIYFKGDRFMPQIKKRVTEKIPSMYLENKRGSKDLEKLDLSNLFDFPKSVDYVKYLISLFLEDNSLMLDYFSGSATSAEACFKLNSETNKKINFIMVQIPEATDEDSNAYNQGYLNLCEMALERIRRAGNKILEETKNNDLDIGFKVFKLDSSNLEKWEPDYNNVQQSLIVDQIKKDRTNEDLVYEIMLKYGIDLTYPIEQHNNIYSIGFGALVICLDDNITKEITNEILNFTKNSSTSRVVFKDNGFASDADKTNIKKILKTNHIGEFITI